MIQKLSAYSFFCASLLMTPSLASAGDAIVTKALNMRAGPSVRDKIIAKLPAMANIDVQKCTANWCYINFKQKMGWVSFKYIALKIGSPNYNTYLGPMFGVIAAPATTRSRYKSYNDDYYDDDYYDRNRYYDDDRYNHHHRHHKDHDRDDNNTSSWSPPPSRPSPSPESRPSDNDRRPMDDLIKSPPPSSPPPSPPSSSGPKPMDDLIPPSPPPSSPPPSLPSSSGPKPMGNL